MVWTCIGFYLYRNFIYLAYIGDDPDPPQFSLNLVLTE